MAFNRHGWEYRVVRRRWSKDDVTYGFYKVHFRENGTPTGLMSNDVIEATVQELKKTLTLCDEAFDKPVLDYDAIKDGYDWEV